jgi:hypothetical protein
MKNNKKKGEMTTEQIVLLIVLIVSFAVILFLLLRLNLGKTTDQEACHNSVATRGAGILPTTSIPLNCKTQYICISKDGSCESMTSPQIEKAKTKTEVYSLLANHMADCWWMFGEGKLNYVGKDFTPELYCSICSQVSFDNSIDFFSNNEIDKKEFYTYLSNTNLSGKDTSYLEYLNGFQNSKKIEESLKQPSYGFGKISLAKQQFILMGIYSKVGLEKWGGAGAGGFVVGTIVISVIATGGAAIPAYIILAAAAAGGGTGYLAGTIFSGSSGNSYLSPTIIEANSVTFNAFNCTSINTLG